jgi:hypothetical protein
MPPMFAGSFRRSPRIVASPQELVGAIQWRFESSLPHQQLRRPDFAGLLLYTQGKS